MQTHLTPSCPAQDRLRARVWGAPCWLSGAGGMAGPATRQQCSCADRLRPLQAGAHLCACCSPVTAGTSSTSGCGATLVCTGCSAGATCQHGAEHLDLGRRPDGADVRGYARDGCKPGVHLCRRGRERPAEVDDLCSTGTWCSVDLRCCRSRLPVRRAAAAAGWEAALGAQPTVLGACVWAQLAQDHAGRGAHRCAGAAGGCECGWRPCPRPAAPAAAPPCHRLRLARVRPQARAPPVPGTPPAPPRLCGRQGLPPAELLPAQRSCAGGACAPDARARCKLERACARGAFSLVSTVPCSSGASQVRFHTRSGPSACRVSAASGASREYWKVIPAQADAGARPGRILGRPWRAVSLEGPHCICR